MNRDEDDAEVVDQIEIGATERIVEIRDEVDDDVLVVDVESDEEREVYRDVPSVEEIPSVEEVPTVEEVRVEPNRCESSCHGRGRVEGTLYYAASMETLKTRVGNRLTTTVVVSETSLTRSYKRLRPTTATTSSPLIEEYDMDVVQPTRSTTNSSTTTMTK